MSPDTQRWVVLGFFLLICFSVAALGSMATARSIGDWYADIRKPAWNPPNWLFGPVWTLLYASMAVAAWLVWVRVGWSGAPIAFALFALQLGLNALWSWLFFGLQNPGAALIEIGLLWASILVTLVAIVPNTRLLLRAEMRLPGRAWLEFLLKPVHDEHTELVQAARFIPRGIAGIIYWYAISPFHAIVFGRMLRGVARASVGRPPAIGPTPIR